MTPDQLPATAQVEPGLVFLWVAVMIALAVAGTVVVVWRHERRLHHDRLTREQVDRSARIAAARAREDGLPWPLEHRDDDGLAAHRWTYPDREVAP